MIKRITAIAALLGVAACSGAIHKRYSIEGTAPSVLAVDARQRVLLSQPPVRITTDANGKKSVTIAEGTRRYCAEPSPDAFTVLGVAASGGGSFALEPTSKNVSAALQAAFSSSETGSTITRTQTINMLREMMFRTCERYLSGAISETEFQTVAARDQRIMVSILAIEQLTGSITPGPVVIGATGNANTGFDPTELSKTLADLSTKAKEAESEVGKKKEALDALDKTDPKCAVLTAQSPAPIGTDGDKLGKCKTAASDVAAAEAKAKDAKAIYEGAQASTAKGLGVSSAGTTSVMKLGGDAPDQASVQQVAMAVKNIVGMTFNQDETLLLCLQVLSTSTRNARAPLSPMQTQCLRYLDTKVRADRRSLAIRYGVSTEEADRLYAEGREFTDLVDRIVPKLQKCVVGKTAEGKPLADQIRAALGSSGIDAEALINGSATEAGARTTFQVLGEEKQTVLVSKLNTVCSFGEPA